MNAKKEFSACIRRQGRHFMSATQIRTNAFKAGAVALVLALGAVFISPFLASVPLSLFVVFCLIAPFLHRLGFFLPLISCGDRRKHTVALTFDDGPDPRTTPKLLELLKSHKVNATFFVTGKNAQAYPELIRRILQDGHSIGNHSFSHDALLVFSGRKAVYRDILRAQRVLVRLGAVPLFYRPPVGITYPVLGGILNRLTLIAVTFSCRAGDRGNRRIQIIADRILKKVKAGDIILLHDISPRNKGPIADWLAEVARILRGLETAGLKIEPLARVIDRR